MSQSSGKLCNLVLVLLLFCTGHPLFGQNYRGPLPTEQSYSLGQFIVSWQIHDGKPWLEIKHESTGSRVLWQTQPGLAFIAAAQGKETVISNRGSFNFSDKIQQKFTNQSIQSITQDDRGLSIRGQVFATHEAIEYEFLLSPVADQQLQFTLSLGTAGRANRLYLKYESEADEKIFGFGAQYTYFNAKGRVLPIWAQEEGHGRGVWPLTPLLNTFGGGSGGNWSTSYTSVPLYMTNHLRSLLLENSEYLIFDMEKPEQIAIEVFARKLQGRILAGNSPLELMEQLTAYTGRMRPLPDWVHAGAIIGTGGGESRVVEIERKLEAHKVPVTAFFLQDWVGQRSTVFGRRLWWNWEADNQLYPNWPDFIQSMKNRGYRVLSYINPFLADSIDKPNLQRNFYQEALDQKFLVLNSKNK
ncbi:MAG: alpha-glucosidase, partial [Proteobacteria bacterium]|nr:alpha-glucosidase [Pseudomonadota bacterium]